MIVFYWTSDNMIALVGLFQYYILFTLHLILAVTFFSIHCISLLS